MMVAGLRARARGAPRAGAGCPRSTSTASATPGGSPSTGDRARSWSPTSLSPFQTYYVHGGQQYRASIEKSISNQSAIGVSASYGRMPLRFYDLTSTVPDFGGAGVESAVAQAREAAGNKDVTIGGGASVIQQCLHDHSLRAAMTPALIASTNCRQSLSTCTA